MIEAEFIVYRWTEESLEFERRLFVKHEIGEQITKERLRAAVESEVYDFKPALYRIVPLDRQVDIEVKGEVVLS